MKISTRGRYALRFMIDLAQHSTGGFVALKDISSRQQISIKYLEQITSLLSKLGLLHSIRGPQGGYKLAKEPNKYTVGEVLRITEGELSTVDCLSTPVNECPHKDECSTLFVWEGLNKVVNNYLNGITLQDILDKASSNGKTNVQNDYCI